MKKEEKNIEKMQDLIEQKYAELLSKAKEMNVTKENIAEAAEVHDAVIEIQSKFIASFEEEKKARYNWYQEYQKKYKKFLDLIDEYNRTLREKMLSITDNLSATRDILSKYGFSVVDNWKPVIKDESLIPREYMTVDTKKIGKVVSALKEDADIPGVEVANFPFIKRNS